MIKIMDEHRTTEEYWDRRAEDWNASSARRSYLTEWYEAWKGQLKPPYLDIGFGSGKFLERLAKDGNLDIYGIDISAKLVRMAREKLRPFLKEETSKRIRVLDMSDLVRIYPEAYFNTLIFSGTLQQVPFTEAKQIMEAIARISQTGAIMYFSTRSITSPPKEGIIVPGQNERTYRLPEGAVKTYFSIGDIQELAKDLWQILNLDIKGQTEKISGEPIENLEGVLIKS